MPVSASRMQAVDLSTHPLMQRYRQYREGIISLPNLESYLSAELDRMSEFHVLLSNAPLEREYIVNSLRTIRNR